MREAFIGILTAVAAVTTWLLFRPHPAAGLPPAVWQVSAGQIVHPDDSRDLPPRRTTSGPATSPSTLNDRLHTKRFDRIDFKQTPLVEVVEFFRTAVPANFWVNWRALDETGITPSTPITLQLTDVRASQCLDLALKEAGASKVLLRYRVHDDVILISVADEFWREPVTRIYNIRDFILESHRFSEAHWEKSRAAAAAKSNQSKTPSVFQQNALQDDSPSDFKTESEVADAMCKLIQEVIDSPSWRDNGGSVGSIRYFAGLLIVTQSPENHETLEQFLAQLRQELSK